MLQSTGKRIAEPSHGDTLHYYIPSWGEKNIAENKDVRFQSSGRFCVFK